MNSVQSFFLIVFLVILWFTHSSVAAAIYDKKGLNKTRGALIGLIPVYGIYRALTVKSTKQMLRGSLKASLNPWGIVGKFVTFAYLVICAIAVLYPVIYLVGASFNNMTELPNTLWPSSQYFTWTNYSDLMIDTNFPTWYKNTLIIAVLNMILGVIFITGAAYVFARFKFKGKKTGLMAILILQVFPSFMGLIAMFTLFQVFGMLGKPTALTILYVGGSIPGNIWLIKGYLSSIPKDLDESAMLDGATKSQIFFKIILPLAVPILSFVAVNQFMAPWMDYMLPRYLLDVALTARAADPTYEVSNQWTLAVGLFSLIQNSRDASYTTFAAGALIVALPITVLYMVFQRFLIEGITAGATKG